MLGLFLFHSSPTLEAKKHTPQHHHLFPYAYPNFDDNPFITMAMRKQMRPYLIPLNHPLKASLDHIFNTWRVLENENTFNEGGFVTFHYQPFSRIRVARHPDLPSYIVKVYLDSDHYEVKHKACWLRLMNRCIGTKNIKKLIKQKKLMLFTVPDKWLYPPSVSSLSTKIHSSVQPVILVETDMDIVSLDESTHAWLHNVTHRHLDELYCILSHGYASSYLNLNIPYCKNGKFACIDTENPEKKVDLQKVKLFLSPEMQDYWEELIQTRPAP